MIIYFLSLRVLCTYFAYEDWDSMHFKVIRIYYFKIRVIYMHLDKGLLTCSSVLNPWKLRFGFIMYRVFNMNGAVSKVNKKFIAHLTRANRPPSAAATVHVSHALPAVRFSCILRGRGVSFQDGAAAGKGFLCAPFWGVQICDYSAAWVSCTV